MSNWFGRTIGLLMQSVTPSVANPPKGDTLAALSIKTNTLNYVYDDDREAVDFIKGTVAACLNARASERGVLKFQVRQGGKQTTVSKLLQKMLNYPNPVQSRTDFMELASQFHDATGNLLIYFVKGDGGIPVEMWIIPTFYVTAVFGTAGDPVPSAYRLADGRAIINAEDACMIRFNSIKRGPYTGSGFLDDMLDTAMLYDLVVQSQKNYFASGGAPNVALIQPAGSILTGQQITDMQKMWHSKYNPATGTSNIAVLPDGVTPKDFGPQELNYNKSKEEIRDAIREQTQVPKILLGDTDNVNLNNGQTAIAIFERTVVLRWGEKVADSLENYFQREYGDDITVVIDPAIVKSFTQIQLAAPATPGASAEDEMVTPERVVAKV